MVVQARETLHRDELALLPPNVSREELDIGLTRDMAALSRVSHFWNKAVTYHAATRRSRWPLAGYGLPGDNRQLIATHETRENMFNCLGIAYYITYRGPRSDLDICFGPREISSGTLSQIGRTMDDQCDNIIENTPSRRPGSAVSRRKLTNICTAETARLFVLHETIGARFLCWTSTIGDALYLDTKMDTHIDAMLDMIRRLARVRETCWAISRDADFPAGVPHAHVTYVALAMAHYLVDLFLAPALARRLLVQLPLDTAATAAIWGMDSFRQHLAGDTESRYTAIWWHDIITALVPESSARTACLAHIVAYSICEVNMIRVVGTRETGDTYQWNESSVARAHLFLRGAPWELVKADIPYGILREVKRSDATRYTLVTFDEICARYCDNVDGFAGEVASQANRAIVNDTDFTPGGWTYTRREVGATLCHYPRIAQYLSLHYIFMYAPEDTLDRALVAWAGNRSLPFDRLQWIRPRLFDLIATLSKSKYGRTHMALFDHIGRLVERFGLSGNVTIQYHTMPTTYEFLTTFCLAFYHATGSNGAIFASIAVFIDALRALPPVDPGDENVWHRMLTMPVRRHAMNVLMGLEMPHAGCAHQLDCITRCTYCNLFSFYNRYQLRLDVQAKIETIVQEALFGPGE